MIGVTVKPTCTIVAAIATALFLGCQTVKQQRASPAQPAPELVSERRNAETVDSGVQLTSLRQPDDEVANLPPLESDGIEGLAQTFSDESLASLEASAISNNPTLRRMQLEAAAEWAKTGYVSKLPDPTIGAMAFTPPMHFDPDRQLAEVQIMQMVPWLSRLHAEQRRASSRRLPP